MLRTLSGRIADVLVPFLPSRLKNKLIERKERQNPQLLGAKNAISNIWRGFQFSSYEKFPPGPDPFISSAEL